MADTIAVTAGTGTTVSTEEVTTLNAATVTAQHAQRVVIASRTADATAVDLIGDSTYGLDVDITRSALPTGASTAALQTTGNSSLADIKTAVETIDNAISGSEMQVDVVGALPAGTALLGKVGIDQVTANANEVVTKTGSVTTEANSSAIKTAVEALDNSVDGNYLNVNANIAGTDIVGGAGAVAAGVQRVTLASDDPAVTSLGTLDNAISGSEMQVDVVAPLPAGTNAIGKLASNTGVDIGDVDILSIAAGDNNIGNVDVASIAAGTNLIGDVDIAPRTTGGWSVGNFTSGDTYTALTNSAQVIKGSAGKFGGYYIYNPNTAATYVEIYNIAAASVTVGTSTAKLVFCIPASSGANLELLAGIPFDTAMSIAATTTGGGNTAPSTALEAMIFYK